MEGPSRSDCRLSARTDPKPYQSDRHRSGPTRGFISPAVDLSTVSEPSERAVKTTVQDLVDGTVQEVTPLDAGKNAVYEVTLADREAVLKVGTATPDRVRAEPGVVDFVGSRTDVPVPTVLRTGDDRLDHPYCLYERVPGRTFSDRPTSLPVDLLADVCEAGGRHLGELHAVTTFDRFGPVVCEDEGPSVPEGHDDWLPLFRRVLAGKAASVDDRFADLRDPIREYAQALDGDAFGADTSGPALVHMDYRPANLVVDPDRSPVTRAVLDWSGAAAAPPAYELAHAETLLTEWPRLDDPDRERLATRFRTGYDATNDVPPVPDPFRVDARLRLVKHFGVETASLDASATEARAAAHRCALASLGVRF